MSWIADLHLKKAKQQIKTYRQAVLKFAFEGKLTNHERSNGIQEVNSFLKAAEPQSEYKAVQRDDKLPEGWKWMSAIDVCSSVRDGTHDTPKYIDHGYPLVTSKNLKEGKIDFTNTKNISEEDYLAIRRRSNVDNGDILFCNDR